MKKLYRYIFPMLTFCLFWACAAEKKEPQLAKKEAPPVNVEVAKVALQDIASNQQFSGRIAAEKQVNLSTKLMGTIIFLDVKEGQLVKSGDVIVKIKSSDLKIKKARVQAEKQQAMVAFNSAEKDLKRFEVLKSQNSATQKEVDDLTTQLDIAKARIETIRQMENEIDDALTYANVTAPFSGKVTKKHLNQGDIAAPGMPILTIESNNSLRAYIHIPEPQVASIKSGSKLSLSVDALEGAIFNGKVDRVNTTSNGEYEAVVSIKSSNGSTKKLKTGMYVKASFEKGYKSVLSVPRKSIVIKGQLKGVYTLGTNKEALLRWLKTGQETDESVTVLSGLRAGETFILNSEQRLTNGQKINITNTIN